MLKRTFAVREGCRYVSFVNCIAGFVPFLRTPAHSGSLASLGRSISRLSLPRGLLARCDADHALKVHGLERARRYGGREKKRGRGKASSAFQDLWFTPVALDDEILECWDGAAEVLRGPP